MTKIEELEQRLEVMEKVTKAYGIFKEEVEQLQKALAELKESKKEGKWKPSQDEKFWYRSNAGIIVGEWFDECSATQVWKINNIPIFKTEQECKKYWHFMDTVKEKSYEFSREQWERGDVYKYMIAYDFGFKNFYVDSLLNRKYFGEIYFKDEESAQYIIDNFKDELMEFWI